MSFWEIALLIAGVPVLVWLAYAVDKKSDWDEDYEDTEVRPLLGVVAPKNDKEEEK
jgi:hypothetical protein